LEMPRVVGSGARVVDDGHGLTIDELAGNVATKDDRISIAYVRVSSPTAEPWLTLEYDECEAVGCLEPPTGHAPGTRRSDPAPSPQGCAS